MEAETLAAPRAEISPIVREPAGANRVKAEKAKGAPARAEPERNEKILRPGRCLL
jgi:hypothetical protein